MLDRRKLAAPVLAQAVSFVVVLVIGVFTGHSSGPAPASPSGHPSVSARPSLTPLASATSSSGAKEHQSGVTVQVPVDVTAGGVALQIPVRVLDSTTLSAVAAGTLSPNAQDTELGWDKPLAAGTYQVCAQPPAGLRFTERSTGALRGWTCTVAIVAPGSQTLVTFHLAPGAGVP